MLTTQERSEVYAALAKAKNIRRRAWSPEEVFGNLFTHLRRETRTSGLPRLYKLLWGQGRKASHREPDIWPEVERIMREFIINDEKQRDPMMEAATALENLQTAQVDLQRAIDPTNKIIESLTKILIIVEGA